MRYLKKILSAALVLLLALTLFTVSVSADRHLGNHGFAAEIPPEDAAGYTEEAAAPDVSEEALPATEEAEEAPAEEGTEEIPPLEVEPLPTVEPGPSVPDDPAPVVKAGGVNGWYIVGAAVALGLLCVGAAAVSRKKKP